MTDRPECHTINFMVTTACSRQCPDCCCGDIVRRKPKHISLDKIQEAARLIGMVDRLVVTGGNPSEHPQFVEVIRRIHRHFQRRHLMLATDGSAASFPDAVRLFDEVRVTHYRAERFPGVENSDLVDRMRTLCVDLGVRCNVEELRRHLRHDPQRTGQCARGYTTASWMDGRVWPCCVACGIPRAASVPLDAGWREKIKRLTLPCDKCVFAQQEG